MKNKGNGNVQSCVQNLLLINRGEVPYERIKGMDTKIIDKPSFNAFPLYKNDVNRQLNIFEPRINLNNVDFKNYDEIQGYFNLNIDILKR